MAYQLKMQQYALSMIQTLEIFKRQGKQIILFSYGIMDERVMQICDLSVEFTDREDTRTSIISELILHRECPHHAVIRSKVFPELTGPCKKIILHCHASGKDYKAGHNAIPCLNCRAGSPAPLQCLSSTSVCNTKQK